MNRTLAREIVYLSPGVLTDAGGFEIIIVGGKVIIKPVPGWEAEARTVFNAALGLLNASRAVAEPELRDQLFDGAQKMLQSQARALGAYSRAE